jgi:hypothetical protein
MSRPEKITVQIEPETRAELAEWAREEGRPVGNLLRRIVSKSIEQRRQHQQQEGLQHEGFGRQRNRELRHHAADDGRLYGADELARYQQRAKNVSRSEDDSENGPVCHWCGLMLGSLIGIIICVLLSAMRSEKNDAPSAKNCNGQQHSQENLREAKFHFY